jgi:hypothetical protein
VNPDTGLCIAPESKPLDINPADAANFQKREQADLDRRPLWSVMTPEMSKQMTNDLRTAYKRLSGPEFAGTPFSILGQSWLHQHHCCPPMDDHLYVGAVRNIHENAHFLPWHRAFLYFHERLLQAVLGKQSFRLPVWDWEAKDGNHVPDAYNDMPIVSDTSTCDGCQRNQAIDPIGDLQSWLAVEDFVGPVNHGGNRYPPMASQGPHNDVHVGLAGYMSQVVNSALDPLFYAHHANIDRMWEFWRPRHAPIALPHDPYCFYDAWPNPKKPKLVRITPQEVVDTLDLAYDYSLPGDHTLPVTRAPIRSVRTSHFTSFTKDAIKLFQNLLPASVFQAATSALGIGLNLSNEVLGLLPVDLVIPATLEFQAKVNTKMRYVLQCADRNNQHAFRIGTFSIFAATGGTRRIAAPLSLTTRDFAEVVTLAATGGFALQYGALSKNGGLTSVMNLDPAQLILTVRLPKL